MRERISAWGSRFRSRNNAPQGAEAALFQGIRVRLTLWYCGILCAALILFGVALYVGARITLFDPIESDTALQAHNHLQQVETNDPHACPLMGPGNLGGPSQNFGMHEIIVCYDQNGNQLSGQNTSGLSATFLNNDLAKAALKSQNGYISGIVQTKDGLIYRYALVVQNPNGNVAGVIMAGESLQVQDRILTQLLWLLLSIGGVALLGAGVGGLFLANRSLAPARLAWARQQRFIADASHEFRTPLTLMRADAEVLLRGRERMDEEDAALLEDIVSETNHMSNIANNMLVLARLDNAPTHREQEVINLAEIAQTGVRRIQALADQMHIQLQLKAETALVIGDQAQLEQAALALLDNALKYNRQGGQVTIRTLVDGNKALLEVSDTGIGIDAENLQHLGERFYRVDKARSREMGGTGLGISIVQTIARTHNGSLHLESVPDKGTTVTLNLPVVHERQVDQDPTPAEENATSLPK